MSNDDFSNYPEQLGEKRGKMSDDWTPREALITMLRRIDKGEVKPVVLVICVLEASEQGGTAPSFVAASPDGSLSVAALELTKAIMLQNL